MGKIVLRDERWNGALDCWRGEAMNGRRGFFGKLLGGAAALFTRRSTPAEPKVVRTRSDGWELGEVTPTHATLYRHDGDLWYDDGSSWANRSSNPKG